MSSSGNPKKDARPEGRREESKHHTFRLPTEKELAVPAAVAVTSAVLRHIHQHARSSMSAEVCGVLIGNQSDGVTVIHAAIEGANAAQGGAHVTFTQDTWEHIYLVKDKDFPEDRIMGWYHSHPGFGVFLSEQDLFIHENFFSSPAQIAWVFDPHSEEEGCFGWEEGKVCRLRCVRVIDSAPESVPVVGEEPDRLSAKEESAPPEEPHEAEPRPRKKGLRRTILLFCLLLMFVAGIGTGLFILPRNIVLYSLPDGRLLTPDEVQRALDRDLQRRREGTQSQPNTRDNPENGGQDGANPNPPRQSP